MRKWYRDGSGREFSAEEGSEQAADLLKQGFAEREGSTGEQAAASEKKAAAHARPKANVKATAGAAPKTAPDVKAKTDAK